MTERNNTFSNLDNIVKDSVLYLRENYRQLFLPFIVTCAALILFAIVLDSAWSYFTGDYMSSRFSFISGYFLRLFFSLSYLLVFPIMLLVARNIIVGSQLSMGELRNQPKTRVILFLHAITKLVIPFHLINFAFVTGLGFLIKPLVAHIIEGGNDINILGAGSDKVWPLPFWVYDNAKEVANYVSATYSFLVWSMLGLTWYIAARWSMTLVSAVLDKAQTFKQSAAFTKGHVGSIFFSISFVLVLFYIVNLALNKFIFILILNFEGNETLGQAYPYISYGMDFLGYVLLTLKWVFSAVILSRIYLLIENKGK